MLKAWTLKKLSAVNSRRLFPCGFYPKLPKQIPCSIDHIPSSEASLYHFWMHILSPTSSCEKRRSAVNLWNNLQVNPSRTEKRRRKRKRLVKKGFLYGLHCTPFEYITIGHCLIKSQNKREIFYTPCPLSSCLLSLSSLSCPTSFNKKVCLNHPLLDIHIPPQFS